MPRIRILDQGVRHDITYEMALAYHGGGALAGVALGFRAMEAAAMALSTATRLWDRNRLTVTSGHPGAGVRDAIEMVTRCVTRGRYAVVDTMREARVSEDPPVSCRFDLSHDESRVTIVLAAADVLDAFAALLRKTGPACDRRNPATEADKTVLAQRVMSGSIDTLFDVRSVVEPNPGRIAHA